MTGIKELLDRSFSWRLSKKKQTGTESAEANLLTVQNKLEVS